LDISVVDTLQKNGSAWGKIMFDRGAGGQVCSKMGGDLFCQQLDNSSSAATVSSQAIRRIFGMGAAMERLVLDPEVQSVDYGRMFRYRNVASMQKWLKG
jgi:hypothetical protein